MLLVFYFCFMKFLTKPETETHVCLQSHRPPVLLLRHQRAAAQQPEVLVLGGIHRQSAASLTVKPLLNTSSLNDTFLFSVQVPLELESPTQISLVDEASGEVRMKDAPLCLCSLHLYT